MKVGIIGAGNMGTALCKSFIKKDVYLAEEITVCDINIDSLSKLKKTLGVNTCVDLKTILKAKIIMIAIKPKHFSEIAEKLKNNIKINSLIVSIMAGVKIKNIKKALNHKKIIRAMPNTPALVNKAVIGWIANYSISNEEKKTVQKLFSSTGYAFEVEKESQIDDTTALSGCGPGFFFYIFDQWLQACKDLELPKKKKKEILLKTLQGSLELLEKSGDNAIELSKRVASKGGATEKGLKILEKAKLKGVFEKTIHTALKRCKEIAQEND